MLASAETIEVIAKLVTKYKIPALVVDPVRQPTSFAHYEADKGCFRSQVMVSTSGAQLLPHEAIAQLSQHLLPHTTILTPNIPEATLLLTQNGHEAGEIQSVGDVETMGRKIQELGPKWVLVKGGHMPFRRDFTVAKTDEEKEVVVDVLVGPEGSILRVESPYQKSTSTHGTGCSLACKNISTKAADGTEMILTAI
jgi:hydroxymethylpyrimidine/phosphomethylpyrimidine kinase